MKPLAIFVSIHEARWIHEILDFVAWLDDMARRAIGVRVGVMFSYSKWLCCPEVLAAADNHGLLVMVDSGAFNRDVSPYAYAMWVKRVSSHVDYVIAPDKPVLHCLRDGLDPRLCLATTRRMHEEFRRYRVGATMLPVAHATSPEGYAAEVQRLASEYDVDYIALGSLKAWTARSRLACCKGRLREVVEAVAAAADGLRLHLLGIHGIEYAKLRDVNIEASGDSGSHAMNYKYKWRSFLACKQPDLDCYKRAILHDIGVTLRPWLEKRGIRIDKNGVRPLHRTRVSTQEAKEKPILY